MMEHPLPLSTFYKGWETYQQSLVETIAILSPEQLALRAASHQWTIGMLAQHMIGNRVWWFQVWMGEGNPELASIAHWDPSDVEWQPVQDAVSLVAGLVSTWDMIAEALVSWTAADLGYVFQPPAALREDERKKTSLPLHGSGLSGMSSNTRFTTEASFPWLWASMGWRASMARCNLICSMAQGTDERA